jgi:hypothetical protein
LIILVTLRTLITFAKAGANDTLFKIYEFILLRTISKIAHPTTKISNLFQPFLKYVIPNAKSFKTASIIKTALKKYEIYTIVSDND